MSTNDILNIQLKLFPIPELENNDILTSKFEYDLSEYPARQIYSTGFNYYVHQSYGLFDDLMKKQGSKNFFWVVNNFEIYLQDQDKKNELIDNVKDYLSLDKSNLIEDSLFFQMWEMNMIFKFIAKNAKINIMTINDTKREIVKYSINKYVERMNNLSKVASTLKYENKNSDLAIILLDNPTTLLDIESNYFTTMMTNTFGALNNLNENGSLIIELDDLFTNPSLKYICMIKALFKQVYVYKPYYSRLVTSQKYLVCSGFDDKSFKKVLKKMENFVDQINKQKTYVADFMTDIKVPNSIMITITFINVYLSGLQHREKNKIIKYIESEDYFGEKYKDYLDSQLLAVQYFLSTFFPIDANDYNTNINKFKSDLTNNAEKIKNYKTSQSIEM